MDSIKRVTQNYFCDLFRVEKRFRDPPRGAAVAFVVAVDFLESAGGFARRGEAKQSFMIRKEPARPGVLHNRRFAAGEVAERAVADPGVLELHARALRATELAARLLEVGLVRLGRAGDF